MTNVFSKEYFLTDVERQVQLLNATISTVLDREFQISDVTETLIRAYAESAAHDVEQALHGRVYEQPQ